MTARSIFSGLVLLTFLMPQQAFALGLGMVRVPDYVKVPIFVALVAMIMSLATLRMLLPRGQRYSEIAEEEKSTAIAMAAYLTLVSTIVLVALLIVGIGLNSYT
ncbi:hypothetical protein [Shimia sp. SDUM112013]|uniref:hypothetical protein n=1 Tax=Shimia sp. SDUM112013 TaxID=3136160 RepID=UPI0032EDC8A9